MKRTKIQIEPSDYPHALSALLTDAAVYDSSCSPEARVIYIEKENGYYLKSAAEGTLRREAEMTRYFHGKGLSGEVLYYGSEGGRDYLLTSRVRGEDCCDKQYLDDPRRLSALLGERLRALHETEMADCPERDRMRGYLATVTENYEKGQYDLSFLAQGISHFTADEAYRYVMEHKGAFKNEVLLHGDYCLPNIMLDDWRFSGFIDLGAGGIGDRHVDLFWGAWTLCFNLGTDAYRDRFFDAYGRDLVDGEMIRLVSACEVFG
ncbi:MAG: aminoglycoside 3'-phosphotransferase [Clostridia bacterium]|nr:aminoglycoside 3'-phosphotransferase [Clostridia bacterium]